jgi:hypothetical protein
MNGEPGEFEGVDDPELELKLAAGALPAMLLAALLIHWSGIGPMIQRIFLTMPVHELGHAITAWFCGYAAVPILWKTIVPETRGFLMPLVFFGGMGWVIWRAWQAENRTLMALGVAVLLVHLVGTFFIKSETAQMLIVFGGDGMGLVLSTLLMGSFFFGKNTNLYQGGLRWGFIAIGAAAFVDIYATWWAARTDSGKIPFGEQDGGSHSDATRLVDDFGWSADQLVRRYVVLGVLCLFALLLVYLWGLWQARKAVEDAG